MRSGILLVIGIFALSACGGGGGGGSNNNPDPTPPVTQPVIPSADIEGPYEIMEGEQVVLTGLTNVTGNIEFTWVQTEGPTVAAEVRENQLIYTAPKVNVNEAQNVSFTLTATADGQTSSAIWFTTTVRNAFTFEDYAPETSALVMAATESYVQLGEITRETVARIMSPDGNPVQRCSGFGTREWQLIDNDNNGVLSAGDVISDQFDRCEPNNAIDTALTGTLRVTIGEVDTVNRTISGSIDASEVLFSEFSGEEIISMQGTVGFEFTENVSTQTRMRVFSHDEPIRFALNQIPFITIENSRVVQIDDLINTDYELSINAVLSDILSMNSYTVVTERPFMGKFGRYPDTGGVVASDGVNSYSLDVGFPNAPDEYGLVINGERFTQNWDNAISAGLFNFNAYFSFISENTGGILELSSFLGFPVSTNNDALLVAQYLSTTPLQPVNTTLGMRASSFPYTKVNAQLVTNGGLLSVTTNDELLPGNAYRFDYVELLDIFNTPLFFNIRDYVTSDAVMPRVTATSLAYRDNDYPTLDATESVFNEGEVPTYHWLDVDDVGITFSAPNSAITQVILPIGFRDDVNVRLQLSNEFGQTAGITKRIDYVPAPASFISLDSTEGEYIGQGAQWFENVPGAMSVRSGSDFDYETNHIDIQYNIGMRFWSAQLIGPMEIFPTVGRYENATRWPFQANTVAGFTFSGDSRGCNMNISDVDVLELEQDEGGAVTRVSLDFTQYCEGDMTRPLHGKIRYNSNLPLNPNSEE